MLLTGEKHIQELMDVCGYKDRDSFRKSVLNVMIEKEWVAMTLPDKPKSKAQRYIITEKGKNAIWINIFEGRLAYPDDLYSWKIINAC